MQCEFHKVLKNTMPVYTALTEEISKFNGNKKYDIVFLLDGSGSVNRENFLEAKFGLKQLVNYFGDQVRLALVQFSSGVDRVVGLVNSKDEIIMKINSMKQLCGGTDTTAGLKECYSILFFASREKDKNGNLVMKKADEQAEQFIILITDGCANNHKSAVLEADFLRSKGVNILVIGIGSLDKSKLNELGGNRSFLLDNFADLTAAIPASTIQTQSTIDISSRFASETKFIDINQKEESNLEVTITNKSQSTIKKGKRLVIFGGDHFQTYTHVTTKDLSTEESYIALIPLKMRASINFQSIPEKLTIQLLDENNCPYSSPVSGAYLEPRRFGKHLLTWKPEINIMGNILIFGFMGSGKSTLANLLFGVFAEIFLPFAPTERLDSHVTQGVHYYEMSKYLTSIDPAIKAQMAITLVDTKGLTQTSYNEAIFKNLVDGKLKGCEDLNGAQEYVVGRTMEQCLKYQIHTFLIVVPVGVIHASDGSLENLKKYRTYAAAKGLKVTMAVTFMDEIDCDSWESKKLEFRDAFGLDMSDIFMFNQTDPKIRNGKRDRELLSMFDHLQHNLSANIQTKINDGLYGSLDDAPTDLPPPPPITEKKGIVAHNFIGTAFNQLSVSIGDEVVILQSTTNGWSKCSMRNQTGFIPTSHIEVVVNTVQP